MKVWILVVKFLFIGALFIVSNNHLNLAIEENFDSFRVLYFDWLTTLYNHGARVTGFVVDSEWLPSESARVE